MAPRRSRRRLRALLHHTMADVQLSADYRATVSGRAPEPLPPPAKPLTEAQQLAWARDGFLAFVVDDLPAEQLREAYDHACQPHSSPDRPGTVSRSGNFTVDSPLGPLLDRMMSSPRTRGALASLLGDDFVTDGAWSGGPGYGGDTHDQQFHKDDTHVPVRDHCTRFLNLFFMPGSVDETMGPTELLAVRYPRTQLLRTLRP